MIKLIKSTFYKEKQTKRALTAFISKAPTLSFGAECIKFEKNFAKYQNRTFSTFVNSGSSANLALIQALLNLKRIKKGDCIGFSALTWSTNIMPIIQLGLQTIPIDIELDTLNISSTTLLETIHKYSIKVLFITHALGLCDDLEKIQEICKRRNIIIIEDTCEALGSRYKNKLLGNFGLASTFSFYVGHHMSTIEGGAICTDDKELATMLAIVRSHGWDRNLSQKDKQQMRNEHSVDLDFYGDYTFYDLGYNLRPTEINGFIGNTQIKYLDEILKKRNKNFTTLTDKIYTETKKYIPVQYKHMDFHSNFAVPIICTSKQIRDSLITKCAGVLEIRPLIGGNMVRQPFFRKYMQKYPHMGAKSNAELVHRQGLYFGNNPELTQAEIKRILKIFISE